MKRAIHFVRLESPSEALRCTCGEWRSGVIWTTARELVTCAECLRRLAEEEHRAPQAPGAGAAHH